MMASPGMLITQYFSSGAGCVAAALLLFAGGASRVAVSDALEPVEDPWPAPDFTLPGVDGDTHALKELRGRHVLVNFWAVWCAPCREEMPALGRLHEALAGDGVTVLGMHAGPSIAQARDFADGHNLVFPIAVDEALALTEWRVKGLPTTYLVDDHGMVRYKAVGQREWDAPAVLDEIRRIVRGTH